MLSALRPEFPDVTVSKIRFLDGAGLVAPSRSGSGYRRFSDADVDRLRLVLALQRDHYLPLKVIKAQLAAGGLDGAVAPEPAPGLLDASAVDPAPPGQRVPVGGAVPGRTAGAPLAAWGEQAGVPGPPAVVRSAPPRQGATTRRMRRDDLVRASGLDAEAIGELETAGLIRSRGGWYLPEDLVVVVVAKQLAGFGIGPRHLRGLRSAADREVALLDHSVAPLLRRARPGSRTRAEETARTLRELYAQLHAALVTAGLRDLGLDPH